MRYDFLVDFFGVLIFQVPVVVVKYGRSDVLVVLLVLSTGLNHSNGGALHNEFVEDEDADCKCKNEPNAEVILQRPASEVNSNKRTLLH